MTDKIKELVNSIRFWQATLATLFVILGHYMPGFEFLWNSLAAYVAVVLGVGTLDSVATKIGAGKEK